MKKMKTPKIKAIKISIKPVKVKKMAKPKKPKNKVAKVMKEFSEGDLHAGSKRGPKVTNPKQALAIGYSEQRRMKKKKRK